MAQVTLNGEVGVKEMMTMGTVDIVPEEGDQRTPCDVCCVVDVSGSMSTEATMRNSSGGREGHGLSLLDVVKHAVKTVIHTLGENDRLGLVTFESAARTEFSLMAMDSVGKKKALSKVDELHTLGATNLWAGLEMGMEVLRKDQRGSNSAVLLLTDGMPNNNPPEGIVQAFRNYIDRAKGLQCAVNTFGFGYSLDSPLLHKLAVEGGGMYSFIPDSSFVGTAFVHAMAGLAAGCARKAQLSLEGVDGAQVCSVLGNRETVTECSWGKQVGLGGLLFGQQRSVVFRLDLSGHATKKGHVATATLTYEDFAGKEHRMEKDLMLPDEGTALSREHAVQWCRSEFVDQLGAVLHDSCKDESQGDARGGRGGYGGGRQARIPQPCLPELNVVESFLRLVEVAGVGDEPCVGQGLVVDMKGQVAEALSKNEFFSRWGRHYLLSLMRSHQQQQCVNFKDPGMQFYGGKLFKEVRDHADDVFCNLPPPKPSVNRAGAQRVTSMQRYHCARNPCFHGKSLVKLESGETRPVQEVRRGDRLAGGSTVRGVVKTLCRGGKTDLVRVEGLLVTPYHPIRVGDEWRFPVDVAECHEEECDAVYSFALEGSSATMMVGGVECVTLGHGLTTCPVVAHPYYGTTAVLKDLATMDGWEENGMVVLPPDCMRRDPATGLICGFEKAPVAVEAA